MAIENETSQVQLGAALIAAGRFFAERDVYGLAWIDRDLVVSTVYGSKAGFIATGKPLTDSVIPFIGSEPYIKSFQADPALKLELPGVVIHARDGSEERYNLSLFWSSENQQYMLLVARASIDATLEIELLRHVRARLMAEAETRQKSEQLARANRDLEDFAAIVSHDLKAPMRALSYAAEHADAALQTGNPVGAREKLEWMRAQTRRMSAMLSGLLDYSSIGRKVEAIEHVDTRALVDGIKASMPDSGGISIAIAGDWPVIDTLKAPLQLVLRNLIDNAVKHHDRERGTISMSCTTSADALLISVSDDGPGIDPAHREAIFLPFRTLANPGEARYDGIGLGLALVQRSLQNAGGSITVNPNIYGSRGTTFQVTWPKIAKT